MTDPETDTLERMAGRLRHLARWLIVVTVLVVSGVALSGVSLVAWARSVSTDSARTAWDQAASEHAACVTMARSRAATIETGHAQFDAQMRFVDLLEGILNLVPPSPVLEEAFAKTSAERARIEDDRTAFDAARPPLDEANCPAPPAGPRP